MKSFATQIEIAAPPERIWELLTNVAKWPDWNTTVTKVDGVASPGGKVTVFAKASPGRAFPLRVAEFDPPKRMVWTGGMPLGLFSGKRTYTLTPRSSGQTLFEMTEVFSGLMAFLICPSIPDLQPSFVEFAACLKRTAEAR